MNSSNKESTARSRFLGHELRVRRGAAGLKLVELAEQMKIYASTLTRFEQGQRNLTQTNLITYLTLCGVVGAEQQELLELARAREDEWWTCPHSGRQPDELPELWFTFANADQVTCWHPGALPELLHTEQFATWQFRARGSDSVEIKDRQRARTERQEEHLTLRPQEKTTTFYLQESTLRSVPVEDNIRNDQMAYLAKLIAEGKVRLRVLPARLDHCLPAVDRFWVFNFAQESSVACVQTDLVSVFAERDTDVLGYDLITQRLNTLALSEQDSAELVASLGEDDSVSKSVYLVGP